MLNCVATSCAKPEPKRLRKNELENGKFYKGNDGSIVYGCYENTNDKNIYGVVLMAMSNKRWLFVSDRTPDEHTFELLEHGSVTITW